MFEKTLVGRLSDTLIRWPIQVVSSRPLFIAAIGSAFAGHGAVPIAAAGLYSLGVIWHSHSQALSYNRSEAARLLPIASKRKLIEIETPACATRAQEKVEELLKALALLFKSRGPIRWVIANPGERSKIITPFTIYSAFYPSIVYLPYAPSSGHICSEFEALHELGHATAGVNWYVVTRYTARFELLYGTFLIICLTSTGRLTIAWLAMLFYGLFYSVPNGLWHALRETAADTFALAHLARAHCTEKIIQALEIAWNPPGVKGHRILRNFNRRIGAIASLREGKAVQDETLLRGLMFPYLFRPTWGALVMGLSLYSGLQINFGIGIQVCLAITGIALVFASYSRHALTHPKDIELEAEWKRLVDRSQPF
jgi:hypothetical protein